MRLRLSSVVPAIAALLLAGPPLAAKPIYHGLLYPLPTRGRLDTTAGTASLTAGRWTFTPDPLSNGIAPDTELIQLFVGDTDRLAVPGGQMRTSRRRTRFTYRNPTTDHGIRKLTLTKLRDGSWTIRASLVGIDLSPLLAAPDVCKPVAVVIGDDDGFEIAQFVRPGGRNASRVKVTGVCDRGASGGWPWL